MTTSSKTKTRPVWTAQDVRDLGVRTDVPTACSVIGIGQSYGYELIKADQFPVKALRVGNRIVVPVKGLLEMLDIGEAAPLGSAA